MRMPGLDTKTEVKMSASVKGVLSVIPNGLTARERTFIAVRNLGPTHNLGVFNSNIACVERALMERYFMCKVGGEFLPALRVRPRTYVRNKWLQRIRDEVVLECRGAPVVTVDRVVNSYTGSKRALYERAAISLSVVPFSARDARLTAFVKYEKQDLSKAPRIINPRSPRFNLVLGQRLKFLEKKIYMAINDAYGSVTTNTVIKGLNVYDVGRVLRDKWERFRDPVALGLDATKFDMHTSVEALRYEWSYYYGIFPFDATLREIGPMQLSNAGTAYCADGKVKFRMQGTRCSGDVNTSLGNCIIMCSLIYARARELGVVVELANNGDDCVVIMERADLVRFQRKLEPWFARYGYRMTSEEPVDTFERIEFCQSRPVQTTSGWCMVRNIAACFTKDPMCLVPIQTVNVLRKWLAAVGDCGMAITRGVPVMHAWYSVFRRHGTQYSQGFLSTIIKNTGVLERMRAVSHGTNSITAHARASFYFAFGINPDEQIALEAWFQRTTISPSITIVDDVDFATIAPEGCHISQLCLA